MPANDQNISFGCPHCGQRGEVIWGGEGKERVLLRLSNGFHVEEVRLPGARHIIVCNICDEIDAPRIADLPARRSGSSI